MVRALRISLYAVAALLVFSAPLVLLRADHPVIASRDPQHLGRGHVSYAEADAGTGAWRSPPAHAAPEPMSWGRYGEETAPEAADEETGASDYTVQTPAVAVRSEATSVRDGDAAGVADASDAPLSSAFVREPLQRLAIASSEAPVLLRSESIPIARWEKLRQPPVPDILVPVLQRRTRATPLFLDDAVRELPAAGGGFCPNDTGVSLWQIGAMKSGSSSLWFWMVDHFGNALRVVRRGAKAVKEPHTLHVETMASQGDVDRYTRLFEAPRADTPCQRATDGTPIYLRLAWARPRLLYYVKHAPVRDPRFMVIFRNPLDRALSHANFGGKPHDYARVCDQYDPKNEWRCVEKLREIPERGSASDFVDLLELLRGARQYCLAHPEQAKRDCEPKSCPYWGSLYGAQMAKWLETIDPGRFLLIVLEQDIPHPSMPEEQQTALLRHLSDGISRFIALPPASDEVEALPHDHAQGAAVYAKPDAADRERAMQIFADDLELFYSLIGRRIW